MNSPFLSVLCLFSAFDGTIKTVSDLPIEHQLVNLDALNLKSGTWIVLASDLSAHISVVVLKREFCLSSRTDFCYSSSI